MSSFGVVSTRNVLRVRRARVMLLLERGWQEQEIAVELRISHRTVQRYKRQERLGVAPRTYPPAFGRRNNQLRDSQGRFVSGSSSDMP